MLRWSDGGSSGVQKVGVFEQCVIGACAVSTVPREGVEMFLHSRRCVWEVVVASIESPHP